MNVGIASPKQLVRKSLCALLSGLEGVSTVVDVTSPSDLAELVKDANLDVLLLDASDPAEGLEALSELASILPGTPVLVLTDESGEDYRYQAICRGARGFVSNDCAPEVIDQALKAMAKGQMWIGHQLASDVIGKLLEREAGEGDDEAVLSPREQETLALLAEGYRNKEIAELLSVSDNTVRAHVASLYRKIQVGGRVEAALYYFGKGKRNGRPKGMAAPSNGSKAAVSEPKSEATHVSVRTA